MTTPTGTLTPDVRHKKPFQAGIIAYRGGKAFLAHHIIDLFPPHTRYIEPFFGAGHVFFAKPHVPYEVVNDLDRAVTVFFQQLRDQPAELIAQLWATPYSREEFAIALQEADNLSPLEEARAFFIRQNQGFAGSANSVGDWGMGHEVINGQPEPVARWQGRIVRLAEATKRLRNTIIEHDEAERVIKRFATPNSLIYCDPPYVPETRTKKDYRHEMTMDDHAQLLDLLNATNAMIVLSGYDNPLYRDALQGWDCTQFAVPAHSAGRVKRRKGKASPYRTECLWRNPQTMDAIAEQRSLWEVAS